jgi:hypothetical protein
MIIRQVSYGATYSDHQSCQAFFPSPGANFAEKGTRGLLHQTSDTHVRMEGGLFQSSSNGFLSAMSSDSQRSHVTLLPTPTHL